MYTLITSVLTPSAKHPDLYYCQQFANSLMLNHCLKWSIINNRAVTLNTFSHDTYIGKY